MSSSEHVDIKPMGMNLVNVGGGSASQNPTWAWRWIYNPVTHHSDYKWVQISGLSNTGLLVRTWGNVDSIDTASNTVVITDGNKQYLKCKAPSLVQLPEVGHFVCMTGISSAELNDKGELVPLLYIRSQSDISTYSN